MGDSTHRELERSRPKLTNRPTSRPLARKYDRICTLVKRKRLQTDERKSTADSQELTDYLHPRFGFMNARLQTWFPFNIQVCLNGREWLARRLGQEGRSFKRERRDVEVRRLSGRVSRLLRMLRAHGIIHKIPRSHRYRVSKRGRLLTAALFAVRTATIKQLLADTA